MAYAVSPVHRRQFALGKRPVHARDCWLSSNFGGLTLSHCPELSVAAATDADGGQWMILGNALDTTAAPRSVSTVIATLRSDEVETASLEWAGRWLLIGNGRVIPDASALMGCLYGSDSSGDLWCSSSPALLRELLGQAPLRDRRRLVHERGVSWFPPPMARFSGVSRLLPSQSLALSNGEVCRRRLLPRVDADLSQSERIGACAGLLRNAMINLREGSPDPLWLGLTAGADSRVLLATAAEAGIGLRTFTRLTARMAVADRVVPPRLAEIAGVSHEFTADRPPIRERLAFLEAHSVGTVSEGDALPFLRGSRDGVDGMSIGGHGFALASGFWHWHARLPARLPRPEDGPRLVVEVMGERRDEALEAALAAWFTWLDRHPEDIDWRDRMFIEQRQAGWLSAKEQVYDMQDLRRIPILNSARFFAEVLALPKAFRHRGGLQRALAERVCPDLAQIPVNEPDSRFLLTHGRAVLRRQLHRIGKLLSR